MDDSDDARLILDDSAVVDLGALELVHATGGDRVAFLQRLLTGDVTGTPVGGGSRSLLLNLKGHIVSDMWVFPRADEVRLVVAPGQGGPTAAALAGYAIMDDFAAAVDPTLVPLALLGPGSAGRLAAAGVALPSDWPARPPWSHQDVDLDLPGGPAWAVRARALGAEGTWIFAGQAAREALTSRLAAAGVRRIAPALAEVLRIESGEPAWGVEITPDYFPMEVGLDGAIDYKKGCYLGQEPIVRIRDRGHINWRLVRLQVRGGELPARGDALESDLKSRAGRVTSAAQRPGAAPVALALLHVSVPAGAEVRIRHGETVIPAVALEPPLPP
jgi:folate-binding protein YgfZ